MNHLKPWFHNVILPDGVNTNPDLPDNPHRMYASIREWVGWLEGKSVLEAGCCGGAVTKYLVEAGCKVTAFDINSLHVAQTEYVRSVFNLDFRVMQGDFERDEFEVHDVVAFLGILYHLENPIAALRKAFSLAREYVLIETAFVNHPHSIWEYRNWEGAYLNQFVPSIPALFKAIEQCGGNIVGENRYCNDPQYGRTSLLCSKKT